MDRGIAAGIIGIILATVVNSSILLAAPFDWLPTFIIVIIVIVLYRVNTLKDGLVTSFLTYVFSQAIIDTLALADYYATNTQYTLTVTTSILPDPIITAISAIIAADIGIWLSRKRAPPPQRQQPQQSEIPPDLQTV